MTRLRLTDKQRPVYEFIKQCLTIRGQAPYIHEIQSACGINSYKSALDRLIALERKGFIRRTPNKHRSIELLDPPPGEEILPPPPTSPVETSVP